MVMSIAMRRPLMITVCALVLFSGGCGYSWVTDRGDCLFDVLQIGEFEDQGIGFRLAPRAEQRLETRLSGMSRPEVRAKATHTLQGRIKPITPTPLAHATDGQSWAERAGVEMELWVVDGQGERVWYSGAIQRARPWIRGATVLDSRTARENALSAALDEAVDDLVIRLLNSSRLE